MSLVQGKEEGSGATRFARGVAAVNCALIALAWLTGSAPDSASCSACAAGPVGHGLLLLGGIAWGIVALLLHRTSVGTRGPLLAILAGAHIGLLGFLLAALRFCPPCLGTTAFSVVALLPFLLSVAAWRHLLATLAGAAVVTHLVFVYLGGGL